MADPSETAEVTHGLAPKGAATEADSAQLLDAIRELSARVASLQADVQTLQAHGNSLPPASERAGWDEPRGGPERLTWVRALDSPSPRGPVVPRLLLEIVFLVAVAVAAAIAELELVEIVAVMGVAWILVALAEWAAARSARRRAEAVYTALPGLGGFPGDPSWFARPAERTVLDVVPAEREVRAKLPSSEG